MPLHGPKNPRCCQWAGDQLCEYLTGAYCMVDPLDPIFISFDKAALISKVGCWSFKQYVER